MRKRLLSMLIALSMVITAMPMLSLNAHAAGTGTADDPFLIYTANDLVAFRDTVNAGNVTYCAKLMNNIDISSISNWVPIAQNVGYKGTFDGTRYTISGLKINTSSKANLGLFGIIDGGTVHSVAVASASIVNSYSMTEAYGGTINIPEGYAKITKRQDFYDKHPDGIISSVGQKYSKSNTTKYNFTEHGWSYFVHYGPSAYARSTAVYENPFGNENYKQYMNDASSVNAVVGYNKSGAQSSTGGIAAVLQSGTIDRCSYTGSVNSPYARAGGLVGWQKGGTLSRSYSAGSVNGTYAGGAVGVIDGGTVINCYSTAVSTGYTKTATIYSGAGIKDSKTYTYTYKDNDSRWGYNYRDEIYNHHYYYCYDVDFYSYTYTASSSNVTVHPGYTNGFACAVNGGTLKNAYYYNTAAINKTFSGNNGRATSTYNLASSHTSNANSASLTKAEYTNTSNFANWDFSDTWTMNTSLGRPVLYYTAGAEGFTPLLVLPTGDKALVKVTAGYLRPTSFNLANYVTLSTSESTAGRMQYTIVSGGETVIVMGDELIVRAPLDRGEYPVVLKGHDTKGIYDDFTVNLTVRAITKVAEPVAKESGFEYSRQIRLNMIGITEGWDWVDGNIIPLNDYDEGYDAVYNFNSEPSYLFDWSNAPSASYDSKTNSLKAKVPIEVLRSAESPWATYITVKNADTGELLPGVSVSHTEDFEFPQGHLTGEDGRVYGEFTAGKQTLKAEKDRFVTLEEEVTIRERRDNAIELNLVPERTTFKMPKVRTKDGTDVPDAQVTVTRVSSNLTKMWNDGSVSAQYAAESEQGLPIGEFRFVNATYGYNTSYSVYATVSADGTVKYYKDASHSEELSAENFIIYVDKLTEPTYYVNISRETPNSTEYTATVTLENINATYGTFGLKYDTSIFDFNPETGIIMGGENDVDIQLKFTPDEMYGGDAEDGYYLFVWQADGYNKKEYNTEQGPKPIATMKFTLKNNDISLADNITYETFTVQPWNETQPAIDYEQYLIEDGYEPREYYSEFWRYTDEQNSNSSLGRGRIAANKATINGTDTRGFYQAAVSGGLGDETGSYFYDVRTIIHYAFDVRNSIVKFFVTDKATGENLPEAAVRLYEDDGAFLGLKKTNEYGLATYAVDTRASASFNYSVIKDGYWPIPESGFTEDRPEFTTEAGKSQDVLVELEKKIYHVPRIAETDETQLTLIDDAALGGEKYGYNGHDFHFRIKAAPGYRIKTYPTTATVSVGDETETVPLDNETGLFALDGRKLYQDPLSVEDMERLNYKDVKEQPDENGFRSYDIIIQFHDFEVEEISYEVTAHTNAKGIVAYDRTKPFADGLAATVDEEHTKLIKTLTSEMTDGPNKKTGTFTFTPAEEGYVVEKVYINGLQIHTYDNRDGFSYTFGEVDADNDITVFYYDGTHPSKDTITTLVVGDYGSVAVSSPVEIKEVMNTRRTFINMEENLTFTAQGITGFELSDIEVETNGVNGGEIKIFPDDPTHEYTFEPPDPGGSKTVYVDFKNHGAQKTPTVFVKSYIYSGRGKIEPCGIQIYNYLDTPDFLLTAESEGDWLVKGVMVGDFNLENTNETVFDDRLKEKTYTMAPLTESCSIGAIFTEKGYPLIGYVDLSQGSNLTELKPISGATVTFTRTDADGNEIPLAEAYRFKTTAGRSDASFSAELPEGIWTVTVTKQGYVKYKITNFTFEKTDPENKVQYFGDKGGTVKKITPYIGSTKTGTSVSLIDAAAIKSGMRKGVSDTVQGIADVDNDGVVRANDMVYVMFNYGKRTVTEKYADFLTSDYPEIPKE